MFVECSTKTTGDNNAGMAGYFLQLSYHFKAAYIWQVNIRERYIARTHRGGA